MLSKQDQIRYNRHLLLEDFGETAQLKLKGSSVLIVGAGGLGTPVLQYLAAAGVGRIGIIDGDVVSESNLQRQVLFDTVDVGKNKALVAGEKLKSQNPLIETDLYTSYLNTDQAIQILENYDVIVDGSDNFQTRYLVSDASSILGKPLIFGSIFKFEGQVSVFNYEGGPTYRCLYPDPPSPGEVPNCSEVGVLGVLPAVIGSIMANETIKVIVELGEVLSGRLLMYNALKMSFSEFSFTKTAPQVEALLENYDSFCGIEPLADVVSVEELHKWMEQGRQIQIIDVRESWERQVCKIDSDHFPMGKINDYLRQVERNKPVIIYCHHGMRSQQVIHYLRERGFNNLINLEGGIHQWALQIDTEMQTY